MTYGLWVTILIPPFQNQDLMMTTLSCKIDKFFMTAVLTDDAIADGLVHTVCMYVPQVTKTSYFMYLIEK